ncbi:MAG: hypothetical protein ACUVX8_13720 [Candidatus Zipacnadales bacterium]
MLLTLAPARLHANNRLIRPHADSGKPVWGIQGGLQFAIWPAAVGSNRPHGTGGPRGLIRVGYPALPDGSVMLVNFIAIEPILENSQLRSFSELELSAHDGQPGKLITATPPPAGEWQSPTSDTVYPGQIETLPGGHAQLTVCLQVEPFDSGAHVYLLASVRTDRPGELTLRTFMEKDSAPLSACILTATMGNYERLRQLYLKNRTVLVQELYSNFTGLDFAPHSQFPLADLPRTANGGVLVAATTDEQQPSATQPDPDRPWFWDYGGKKLTQYWRKDPGEFDETLCALVNARRVYWMSNHPIPGGIAFENFELAEHFMPGRATVFGVSELAPEELLLNS